MRILVTRVLMTEIGQTNVTIRSRNTEFCIKRLCNFGHANADTLIADSPVVSVRRGRHTYFIAQQTKNPQSESANLFKP